MIIAKPSLTKPHPRRFYRLWDLTKGIPFIEIDLLKSRDLFPDGKIHFLDDALSPQAIDLREFCGVAVVTGPEEEAAKVDGDEFDIAFRPNYDETPYRVTFLKYDVTGKSAKTILGELARSLYQKCVVQDAYLYWRATKNPIVGGVGAYHGEIVCEVVVQRCLGKACPGPSVIAVTLATDQGRKTILYLRYVRRFVLKSALAAHHPLHGTRVDGMEAIRRYIERTASGNGGKQSIG